jgi:hypothetical protein
MCVGKRDTHHSVKVVLHEKLKNVKGVESWVRKYEIDKKALYNYYVVYAILCKTSILNKLKKKHIYNIITKFLKIPRIKEKFVKKDEVEEKKKKPDEKKDKKKKERG